MNMNTNIVKSVNPVFTRKSGILVIRNTDVSKTTKSIEKLSSYGLTESNVLGFSLGKVINMCGLAPINEVFVKKRTIDNRSYNSIKSYLERYDIKNVHEYESSISPEEFVIDPCKCKLIVGGVHDLWGDATNKTPHENSILYSLNKHFDIDNKNVIFPESGKSVYIYNKNQVQIFNTFF